MPSICGNCLCEIGHCQTVKLPSPSRFSPIATVASTCTIGFLCTLQIGLHQVLSENCNSFRSYLQHKPASTLRRYGCSTKCGDVQSHTIGPPG